MSLNINGKNLAIEFRGLSKSFQTWHDRPESIKTMLSQMLAMKLKFGVRERASVLENINLEIGRGEFVGLMGRNGAGKSTLLKLIAGIYQSTSGSIVTHGRIAPLLELGAGFADELTGYENIFLNGSILGFNRAQIYQKVASISEFSELGDDLHKPVRNYSSGMLVRLGFAVAAHLDAEILLFDEILAVGDIGFQNKCLSKIRELHRAGKTIVLVTHSPEQVLGFCSRCIVFEKHGVVYDGEPAKGVEVYKSEFR